MDNQQTSILDWVWRILGATVISGLLVLLVTMWNHMNERITNCENVLSDARSEWSNKIGSLEGDIKTEKCLNEKIEQKLKEIKEASKEKHSTLDKDVQSLKERLVVLEERMKKNE